MPEAEAVHLLAQLLSGHTPLEQIPPEGWAPICQAAIRHKLGPLLDWTIEQQGFDLPDPAARQALKSSAKIADFNYQLLKESQAVIGPALSKAGIDIIWLKGLALAQTIYPRPHLRPMDDLDLLVPYDRRETALQTLQDLGYRAPSQDPMAIKMGAPLDPPHHYHLMGGPAHSINIELHYRLLVDDRLLPLGEMKWFWQESEAAEPAGLRVLKAEAHLLYLSAHAILQHGEADFRLQRYYDLHLLAQQPGFNWAIVISRARSLGWMYALERALTLTRDYFGSPIPQDVFSTLQARSQPEETETRARRLQGGGRRWEGTLLSMEGLSLRERLQRLFWLAFPPPSYLRSRYDIPAGKATVPYYFYRWSDAGREIIKAIAHRLK